MTARWPTYAIWGVLLGTVLLLFFVFSLSRPERELFLEEGGPVEMASALLYFVAAAVVAWLAGAAWRHYLPEIIVFLSLGAREFDLDDRHFTNGLMKPNQYIGPDVNVPEKLVSAAILVVLIWATAIVLWRYLPSLWRWHREGNRAATAGLVAIAYIFVSELMDSPSKKVEVFGLEWGAEENMQALFVEETLELGIPFLLIIAVIAGFTATVRAEEAVR